MHAWWNGLAICFKICLFKRNFHFILYLLYIFSPFDCIKGKKNLTWNENVKTEYFRKGNMSVVVIMRHGIACRAQLCKIHDKDYTILIGVRSM